MRELTVQTPGHFPGDANHNSDGATITDVINPASSTITVTGSNSFTYSGSAQGPSTSNVTGSGGAVTYSYSGTDNASVAYGPSSVPPTNAGTYTVTATVAADANYNSATSTAFAFTIDKANATVSVTPYSVTYDAAAHTATGTATGVASDDLSSLLVLSGTTHTGAGNYTGDGWSFTGNDNYNASTGTVDDAIAKADAGIVVTPYSVTYDGSAHTATVVATGVEGEDLASLVDLSGTEHTDAGTYNGDAWTFAGNSNYNTANGSVDDAIAKANATISVTPYNTTYDGTAHTATYSATGVLGETLSGMDVNATTHTTAGSYATDAWVFTDVTGNYNDNSGTVDDEIGKADATISVTSYTTIYDGTAHIASGTATGAQGEDLSSLLDFSSTSHTDAGTYTADTWSFAGDANYNSDGATITDVINPASSTITVTGSNSFTYSGSAQGPSTSTVTGSGGAVTYSYSGTDNASVAYGPSSVPPTNAGTYTVTATVAADANYNSATSTAFAFTINKADATISVTQYGVTYDAAEHTATGTATGVESEDLSSLLDLSGTSHTGAGNYTGDAWTFAGNSNYNATSGTVDDAIAKANADIVVTPYSVTYDGVSHSATTVATGVEGEDLASLVDLSGTVHTIAGTYNGDAWTFAGNSNYNTANGSVDDAIAKANATINVAPYDVPYDATSHTAVGTATGAQGEDLSSLFDLSATTHTDAGTYNGDAWSFAGNGNYNADNGTVNDAISAVAITVTADAQTKVFGDPDPALTYQVTNGALAGSDAFTGTLSRDAGEAAGTYAINQGNLALSSDYILTFIGANLTINNIPITASATSGIVECAGGTTNLTVTASGGDGALQYSLNGGAYQSSNIFTVDAAGSPYVVTVKDGDGFTLNTNSVTVTEQPSPTISLTTGAETAAQTICVNNYIDDIVYSIGGNTTGATVTALPTGLTGTYDAGTHTFTISGMPSVPGSYSYTVTTTGPCDAVSLSGTIVVNDNATISLSSANADQTVCINSNINNITFSVGGGATGADVAGLPDGVTGSYDSQTGLLIISGTPTVSGTFDYTVTTYGPCDVPTTGGTITVNANSTLDLSSTAETTSQVVCINTGITPIEYQFDGGATTAAVTGLPGGVIGTFTYDANNKIGTFTISGTPTESGTFSYTVTASGPCQDASLNGTITVNPDATISLVAAGTDQQTVCINNNIYDINYSIGGSATDASISAGALPDGVSWTYTGGVFKISGTPTESGVFNYTVTAIGPCEPASLSGTITVNANSTISLSSSSADQTVCINNAMSDDITYTVGGGATDANVTGLPAGISGSFNSGVLTITGTPTESGTFTYTVTATGPCEDASLTGTITVNANSTISLSSASGTDAQTVCMNSNIVDITYAIGGGGTNAIITNGALPSGVTGSFSGGVFTITGAPTEAGVFNYTITTEGPCVNASVSGSITINPTPVVNAVSDANYCNNATAAPVSFSSPTTGGTISYSWTSSADVGFGTSGSGNIASYTATNNTNAVITATVSVTPHFTNNSVTCEGVPITFNITVNPSPVVNSVSNISYCNNNAASAINFTSPTSGGTVNYSWSSTTDVGFGINGTGNIPAFTATNNSINPVTATVTVTPSLNGCTGSPVTFTVTVKPKANAGTISGSSTICNGLTAQLSDNGSVGGTWSSSTPSIASVDAATGLVTGNATGNATIFYTVSNECGASTTSFTVSVNPTAVAGTISGPSTVCAGSSIALSTNGNSGGTWFSGNPGLATVTSSGVVTGVSGGTATIFYYVVNSCGSSVSPYSVTVTAGANPGTIIGSSTICAGSAALLFTTGSTGGTWSSSNPSVAMVDATTGFVIGMNAGNATIAYTVPSNSCTTGSQVAYFNLVVNPAGNAGTITGSSNMCAGSTTLLSTDGSSGGTWYSGNPSIASVSPSGLVTGLAPGTVTIGYFVTNTCGTSNSTFNITVSPGANAGTISGPSSVCTSSTISLSSSGTPGGNWTSSNTSVAIVDGSGNVLGVGAGTSTITYTVTSACASSSISTNITVNPVPVAGTVSGASSLCAGLSTTFSSNGTAGGTWSSSNPAVASVNSASGVVTAVAEGNAVITYTVTSGCGTVSQSAPITINPVLNAGSISGGAAVCVNSTLNLAASGNSGGQWTSSNGSVATVDANTGIVSALAAGNTTITYTVSNGCGTSTTTKQITVNPLVNAGIVSGSANVCTGVSTTFTSNGTVGGSWSSSAPSIASVNASTGVVTGVSAGNATITYTVSTSCGTSSASAAVTVNQLADAGTITGNNSVCVGISMNLSSNITGGTWHSNSSAIATVNAAGQVTGMSAGSTTITYTVTTTCGTNVASFPITVNPVPDAGTVDGPSSVCTGSTIFLTNMGGMTGGVWRSANPARASVDPVTGEITGISAGNTIITYSVTNSCGSSTAGMVVTVNSLPNAGTISGLSTVCENSSINLSASGDAGGTWSSNAPGVATVNPTTGVVTGVSSGTATIIYTVGSATVCGTSTATHLVTVNPLPVAGTISGTTTVCAGLSTTLVSDGTVGGTWSSSNPSVASVNSASGVVTAVTAGNATINYTVTNNCGSKTASVTVTVNPLANAGTISGPSSVCVNANVNLSSNVSGGTWSSSSNSIATIDPTTGLVTGVAAGNSTITYTVTTSCGTASTTFPITVNPLPNAGVISGTTYLCIGSNTTLSSNMSGGTWSSSNTSAATVNPATGVVTGVAAGSSTITYTVSSGCGVATATTTLTIGQLPNAGTVTGVSSLCTGSTAIFTSNGTGGGSWSSNNPAAATVDPVTGLVTGVAAGSATITYTASSTCGSSVSSANITISALPNAGSVSGSGSLCVGSLTPFTSNGTGGGTWSSNNNLVATVNASTGVVTGISAGTATITYTVTNICGTATATSDITINALPNSGTVSGAASVCVGASTGFTSTGNGGGSWSSSNTAAATVDPVTGAVTGVSAGSATISYTVTSATCGNSVSSANITINPLPNPGVVSGLSSVCVGATITLSSSGSTGGTWSSNNTSVATVDPVTGVVSGLSAGSTTISYTVTNGCGTADATLLITVNPLPDAGTISGSATVCVGSSTTYTSNGLSGTWTSSDPSIATVDANSGLISGISSGTATITYTVTTPCGTTSTSSDVTVIALPNAGVVSGATSVCVGSTTTYTSDGMSGGTWSSVTPSVATVDPVTGVISGVSAGNATITYTFTNECGTNTASKLITVDPLPNAGTISGSATVCIGSQATYSSDGLAGGTWSSSDPSIASVDGASGIVTGVSAGNVTITYTSNTPCGSASSTTDITVIAIPDAGTVSGSSTVCVGATTTYTSDGMSGGTWSSVTPSVATVDPVTGVVTGVSSGNATITYTFTNECGSNSSTKMIHVDPLPNSGTVTGATAVCVGSQATFSSDGLAGGTWSSSNPAMATVESTTGIVHGVAPGVVTITYTSTTPCGTTTSTASITVNPVLTAGTVSGSATLCIGSNTTYTSDGSTGGTWSSVTPSVATVNPTTGVVTGVSTGNATITYTVSSDCGTSSSTKMVAVSLAANPGTVSGASTICSGSHSDFSHPGGVNGGVWSSSNTAVATVSASGRVTGVSAGTAVISYSVTSGCGTTSSTKTITVNEIPGIIANNVSVNTDPNECSAVVTLGSNVTVTGSDVTLQYRIGYYFFSWPISSTHRFYRGTTPVTVIASNSCGRVARTFNVTVTDNQPPTITCTPNATRSPNGHSSRYSIRGHEFDATASDNCGIASLIYSLSGATVEGFERHNTSLNNVRLNVGTTTITWKATDVNGNVSTCSSTVTVSANAENQEHHNYYRNSNTATDLNVKVSPNPTSYYFTLQFSSVSTEKVKLSVVDVTGRTVQQMSDIDPNSTVQIGSSYRPGTYIVHAVQGSSSVTLKVIKEGKLY